MVFSSVTFLFLFLPVSLLLYYLVPKKLKNFILLITSLIFYAWGEPVYVILMLYSILMNYGTGLLIEQEPKHKKLILTFAVILNLFVIGFFKYYGFLVGNINALFGTDIPIRELALPVGISFYTFQALSYVIDLYRGKFRAQHNIVDFAAYITMFPQLIAGPIVRYEDVAAQLQERKLSLDRFGKGALRFIFGLSKKVLLANLAGGIFDEIMSLGPNVSTLTSWIGAVFYTFQIFFDFSGYSDMAIGLGEMLGFKFMENFNYPYAAKNVTDFWRRWHISLSTWFKEYVYIPLGGNRVSVPRHILNLLIVWFLTGLWHGASWNFVLWGVYYGSFLIFEKYIWSKFKIPGIVNRLFTIIIIIVGWVIFSGTTLSGILTTLSNMFFMAGNPVSDETALYYLSSSAVLFVFELIFSLPVVRILYQKLTKKPGTAAVVYVFAIVLLILSIAFLVTENYNPFLYFRF